MGPDQPRTSTAPRFTLKPTPSARGYVDGAWWPRSNDPATEFPALLSALTTSSGPMTRLSYNLTAWRASPRRLAVGGRPVRIEGFRSLDPRTVSLTDPSGHRTVLLLVPPEATERRGNALLARAARPDNVASPRDLLYDEPEPLAPSIPEQADESPEARWETEGGHLLADR